MVSLRFISQQVDKKDLVLAMALVQGVRYLGTILLQPLAAFFVDHGGFSMMSYFLVAVLVLVLVLSLFFKDAKRKISRSLWEHEGVKKFRK